MHTVVQHSGFGYAGDTTFRRGLESRTVTPAQARKVEKAGGILFETYVEAEDFAEKAMFPPGAFTMIPEARGTFSTVQVDGLAVYVPVREVVG